MHNIGFREKLQFFKKIGKLVILKLTPVADFKESVLAEIY
jgi:hypothetical protein